MVNSFQILRRTIRLMAVKNLNFTAIDGICMKCISKKNHGLTCQFAYFFFFVPGDTKNGVQMQIIHYYYHKYISNVLKRKTFIVFIVILMKCTEIHLMNGKPNQTKQNELNWFKIYLI